MNIAVCFSVIGTQTKVPRSMQAAQRYKQALEKKNKIFMIISEIPKAIYCSFFCFLLTMDECIINVWGYTEILPSVLLVNLSSVAQSHTLCL